MKKGRERKRLKLHIVTAVLTEAGYRCAVPTCRQILAIDLHHIWEIKAGGPDKIWNLIALCPTCHALYHRGTIQPESIYAWKSVLVALGRAFDTEAVDKLLFVEKSEQGPPLMISGDGVLSFGRLISAGLVAYHLRIQSGLETYLYGLSLTPSRLLKLA